MANEIRIRRRAAGGSTGAPSSLKNAELAYNESDSGGGILYYGAGSDGSGNATSIITVGGAGAFVNITGTQTISGDKTFTGAVDLSGATVGGFSTTGNLTIGGNLTVQGTTTTIESTTVVSEDKNIELGSVATPTDATADGGGITLRGASDKTIAWVNATDAWTFSEHINIASGKEFRIGGTSVLTGTTLGSGVVNSSLTSVGTISTGVWQGSGIGVAYGGTGQTSFTDGQLLIGSTSGNTLSKATLTAGNNITITNGGGSIEISAAAGTPTGGDGIATSGSTVSVDPKANGGLVIESAQLAVDLGASNITGTLAVGDGGTGATTAAAARTNLGLVPGTDVQAQNAELTTLAGMSAGTATALAALTSTEVAILDGATITTAEANVLDGDTAATATTLAATDRMVINDAGTMVQVALSDLVTFLENGSVSGFSIDGGTF